MNDPFNKLVITEIGFLHDWSFAIACNLIYLVKKYSVNAVKFQIYNAEYDTLKNSLPHKYFNKENRNDYFIRTAFELWATKYFLKIKNIVI